MRERGEGGNCSVRRSEWDAAVPFIALAPGSPAPLPPSCRHFAYSSSNGCDLSAKLPVGNGRVHARAPSQQLYSLLLYTYVGVNLLSCLEVTRQRINIFDFARQK